MTSATPQAVKLTIYGGVVDPAYSRLLMQRTDLPFTDVLALDRVQKNLPIPREAAQRLRRAGLIEGRRPHLHVAAVVAAATGSEADCIRTRAQDDTHYAKLVTDYLEKFGSASRHHIDTLLWGELSDAMTDEQKSNKIANLLAKMKRSSQIRNKGTRTRPVWRRIR